VENLRFLESGRAQLAAAQADVTPGPSAQIVAVLYDDVFQLLTHPGSKMENFSDLRGKRIALAQTGGQFGSFLRVADHFGLHEPDFHFVGSNDSAADAAFLNEEADAIFRVRALGNPTIQRLVQAGKVRFLRIEQASAMKIGQPAFQPAIIPKGAYLGEPPVPPEDLPTVGVPRTLLASSSADSSAIRAITSALIERRQEVMAEIPASILEVRLLLAEVRKPEQQAGLAPILHPGAASFYDKDKPSFLLAHADYVGLLVTIALMIGSWVWELKQWMQRQQKNKADAYSRKVLRLMAESQEMDSAGKLDEIRSDLLGVPAAAFADLDADRLSEESFHSFRAILQIALDVVKEKRATATPAPVKVAAVI
jgi:TRAP transporter TAXI family solute receptor